MAITAFLSMWLSNTATAAMMLTLILPVVGSLPEGSPTRKGIILAVPFAATAAARLVKLHPGEDTMARLYASAEDLGPRGRDEIYGHGLLQLGSRQAP